MKTITQRIQEDAKNISLKMIKNKNAKAKKIYIEIILNPFDNILLYETIEHVIFKGQENDFLNSLGLIKCQKKEAKYCCFIGEKKNGMFLKEKTLKLWIKHVQ